ncbi:glycine betaine ABC transporter substrate-binding protein [Leucobacter denitrificans]|uniref:ABC-type glycine betaine transport system substrate-binding domain-containing protein n=1 Tax=Leucobacter denitrificans TaxID=683042 RepID=A0A7G9S273_9MICO|nr:glycine betaine ABC transporter substrate-binding protein [Leucobacter denitrificans]QNN61948.1 hypothetical protein H9L06_06360 [Leucobacter denitrificans]
MVHLKKKQSRFITAVALGLGAAALLSACAPQSVTATAEGVPAEISEALAAEGKVTFTDNLYMESSIQAYLMAAVINEAGGEADVLQGRHPETMAAMSNGDAIVSLDIWRWQYPDLWEQYVEQEGVVVEVGTSEYTGEEGWYVPSYVVEGDTERGIEPMCPGLPDWEALNECVDVFKSAKTGDKGQYTTGAEAWADAYGDTDRIANLDLNYEMVFAGSEAALFADLTRAYEQGKPWLGLMWRPNYMTHKYDLTRVDFPEYSDECWGNTYACQWPETTIYKIASTAVQEDHPTLFGIVENYGITNEQLHEMQSLVTDDGMSPEDAAESWMDENTDIWQAWLTA